MSLNSIIIQGRLTADPELRQTQSGVSVVNFTVACNREHNKEETDFISCIAWRQTAEFVSKYFRKGQLVLVRGSLQSRKWTDRDGGKRINWDVVCDNVYFCESKKDSGDGYTAKTPDVTYTEVEDDGELPF